MGQAAFERLHCPVDCDCEVIPGCRSPPARLGSRPTITRVYSGLGAGNYMTRNDSWSHRARSPTPSSVTRREPATSAAIRRSLLLLYFSGSTQPSSSYCSTGPAYVIGPGVLFPLYLQIFVLLPPSILTLPSSTTLFNDTRRRPNCWSGNGVVPETKQNVDYFFLDIPRYFGGHVDRLVNATKNAN